MNDAPIPFAMDTISLLLQIPPQEIAYLSFIIESYEGVAVVRTIDPRAGLVELMSPPGCREDLDAILADLAREFPIKEITPATRVITRDSCAGSG